MTALRHHIPTSALGRVRAASMVFACLMVLGQLGNLGNPAHARTWSFISAAGLLALVGVLAVTYRRGRLMVLEPLLVPGLVALAGSGLVDSVATFGLCIAATVAQSMYGGVRLWLLRTGLLCAAFLVAVAVSPYSIGGRWVSWHSVTLLTMVPQLVLLNVLVRGLYRSLLRQSQASERDAVLAHTGSQLIGTTDIDQVHRICAAAAERLAVLSPGTVTVVLEDRPTGATVVHGTGIPDAALGTVLPAEAISALDAADTETARTPTAGLAPLEAHTPAVRHWRAIGLGVADGARYLLVGAARPVSGDVVNAFRSLGHQAMLAEASCRSHQTLDYQANHDSLTRIPNRARFFARLRAAIDEQMAVTLLVIDLDDFKTVNDTYGHAAGDELLIEVAARLVEVGGPGSVAGRFGGDEFAMLLTGSPDDDLAVPRRLCERLMEPMRLSTGTITVGASIGVAVATAGLTAGDLMRCADIAMYSARPAARTGSSCSPRRGTAMSPRTGCSKSTWRTPWSATRSCCGTSRTWTWTRVAASASKPRLTGSIRRWASSRPRTSFRWPNAPV
jgi:diguanylate cyclase (GGDEF)-like protein